MPTGASHRVRCGIQRPLFVVLLAGELLHHTHHDLLHPQLPRQLRHELREVAALHSKEGLEGAEHQEEETAWRDEEGAGAGVTD